MKDDFYGGLALELLSKLRRLSAFVSHGPSIGAHHEASLRAVLRPLLPDRFSLRTGFVYHPERGASRQGDILIVDEARADAYFYREGDFAVVSERGLVAAIEVKTRLTRRTFVDAIECLASFQRHTDAPNHPVTLLFAYESEALTPARLDAWYRAVSVRGELYDYPMAICALSHGLLNCRIADGQWGHQVLMGEATRGPRLRSLAIFLQTIRKSVLERDGASGNPFSLVNFDGLSWSRQWLRYGEGLVDVGDA